MAVTLAEMAISGGFGLNAELPCKNPLSALFSEELGAVLQVADQQLDAVIGVFSKYGLGDADVCTDRTPYGGPRISTIRWR